jgi:hypothetical protein
MKRTWVIIVVAILALVAGLAGLGYFLIGRFDVKGLIEKAAYEQTGRVLTIKGAVQPAFYPSIGVHARDVTLANVAGGEAPSLLEAEEIQIGVAVVVHAHFLVSGPAFSGASLRRPSARDALRSRFLPKRQEARDRKPPFKR